MSDMKERVALVTGASSGIGRAVAEAFAQKGAKVVVAARREPELVELAAEIVAAGGEATYVVTDVSVASDVERMVAHAIDTFGRLDYAVNNAGIEGELASITSLPEEEFDRVIAINLKGTFMCLQHESRAMLASGRGGAIVNVGSVNSFLGSAHGPGNVASKHGLIGLTTSASAELASPGIRVNLLCPGIVATPMNQRLRDLFGDALYDEYVMPQVHVRRMGQPEEMARAILFLCSDDASYITGTTLTPDGGFTLTV